MTRRTTTDPLVPAFLGDLAERSRQGLANDLDSRGGIAFEIEALAAVEGFHRTNQRHAAARRQRLSATAARVCVQRIFDAGLSSLFSSASVAARQRLIWATPGPRAWPGVPGASFAIVVAGW